MPSRQEPPATGDSLGAAAALGSGEAVDVGSGVTRRWTAHIDANLGIGNFAPRTLGEEVSRG